MYFIELIIRFIEIFIRSIFQSNIVLLHRYIMQPKYHGIFAFNAHCEQISAPFLTFSVLPKQINFERINKEGKQSVTAN